jgi:hypothetical protein
LNAEEEERQIWDDLSPEMFVGENHDIAGLFFSNRPDCVASYSIQGGCGKFAG